MSDDTATPFHLVDLGYCRWCGRPVRSDSFADDAESHHEYMITAACSACQTRMFGGQTDPDLPDSCPILHGAIVGTVSDGAVPREAALLPFRYDPWHGRFEWEPRHIVRAGDVPGPIDPFAELGAMRDAWSEHDVRVLTLASFDDALLAARMERSHVVVALHRRSVVVTTLLCPSVPLPALVDLAAQVPWADAFGAPLLPLEAFIRAHRLDGAVGSADACFGSALRQCALLARLLELRATAGPRDGCTAFEHFLFGNAQSAGPSIQEPSDGAP